MSDFVDKVQSYYILDGNGDQCMPQKGQDFFLHNGKLYLINTNETQALNNTNEVSYLAQPQVISHPPTPVKQQLQSQPVQRSPVVPQTAEASTSTPNTVQITQHRVTTSTATDIDVGSIPLPASSPSNVNTTKRPIPTASNDGEEMDKEVVAKVNQLLQNYSNHSKQETSGNQSKQAAPKIVKQTPVKRFMPANQSSTSSAPSSMVVYLPEGQQQFVYADKSSATMSVSEFLQQVGVEVPENAHIDLQSLISTPKKTVRASPKPTANRQKPVVLPVLNAVRPTLQQQPRPQTPPQPRMEAQQQLRPQRLMTPTTEHAALQRPQSILQQQEVISSPNLPQCVKSVRIQGPRLAQIIRNGTPTVRKKTPNMTNVPSSTAAQISISPRLPVTQIRPIVQPSTTPAMEERKEELANQTQAQLQPGQKVKEGFVVICPFCGICNLYYHQCHRCKRKLPANAKIRPLLTEASAIQSPSISTKIITECKGQEESDSENKKIVVRRKKKAEEPVVLVLSSDDEDGGDASPDGAKDTVKAETKQNQSKQSSEPVYSPAEMANMTIEPEFEIPEEPDDPFTSLHAKQVRVGNFKSELKHRAVVSSTGIQFAALSAIDGDVNTIFIRKSSIKAVIVYCGSDDPRLLIYPTRGAAARIRMTLGVSNEGLYYFDPCSAVQAFRRLIITLDKLTEENKTVLSSVFGSLLLEIEDEEMGVLMARVETKPPPIPTTRTVLTFEKLEITNTDYACLAEETYINDVIIDFYLTYLSQRVFSPEDRARTHIFSSFFYNRLTKKLDRRECSKDSPAEKRHKRVRRWTKKTNLFEKDFIIIPINENSHWFLAVICYPHLMAPVHFSDNTPITEVTPTTIASAKTTKKGPSVNIGNTTITHIKNENGNRISINIESDRDEAEAEDDLSDESDDDQSLDQTTSPPPPSIPLLGPPDPPPTKPVKRGDLVPIKQPCILIFDSLRGSNPRARVVATLRDFLKIEYKWKTGLDRDFNKDNFKGSVLKVPQQNNYFDCGLFVLQYVESFFEKPLTDYRLPIRYLNDWFSEEQTRGKRLEVAELIESLMREQGVDPRAMNLPDLSSCTGYMNSDEMEEDADMDECEYEEEGDENFVMQTDVGDAECMDEDYELDNMEDDSDDIEEGEVIQGVQSEEQSESEEISSSPEKAPCKQTVQMQAPWNQTVFSVQTLLKNHGPADPPTRQSLKNIRIKRGNHAQLTIEEQSAPKKQKSDVD